MARSNAQVIEEFDEVVNITRKELQKWIETDESKSVGQGDGESKGHESGRKIVEILSKKKSDYYDDIDHTRKVVGYVNRHQAQKPECDVEGSNWRYSLLKWVMTP